MSAIKSVPLNLLNVAYNVQLLLGLERRQSSDILTVGVDDFRVKGRENCSTQQTLGPHDVEKMCAIYSRIKQIGNAWHTSVLFSSWACNSGVGGCFCCHKYVDLRCYFWNSTYSKLYNRVAIFYKFSLLAIEEGTSSFVIPPKEALIGWLFRASLVALHLAVPACCLFNTVWGLRWRRCYGKR